MLDKMLTCMSSKNLDEHIEPDYGIDKARSESKADLRRLKSFSCQILIHPSTFVKRGMSDAQAESELDKDAGISDCRGWKGFISSLDCSKAPLRSTDAGVSSLVPKEDVSSTASHELCKLRRKNVGCKLYAAVLSTIVLLSLSTLLEGCPRLYSRSVAKHFALNARKCLALSSLLALSISPHRGCMSHHMKWRQELCVKGKSSSFCALIASVRCWICEFKRIYTSCKADSQSRDSSQTGSPTCSSYHMARGSAVRVAEEPQVSNRNMNGTPTCLPGTEWFSQVELGVFITFVTLPNGCNALKRIRFSRDIFSKKEAESWWAENGNRVRAVYNIPAFERTTTSDHPTSSSEEETSGASGYATPAYSPGVSRGTSLRDLGAGRISRGTTVRDAVGVQAESPADEGPQEPEGHESEEGSEQTYDTEESTWVEEDVPGVYLTLMNLVGGGRELKRVRFSREKFTEKQAKIWWDENRGRILKQYL